MEAIGIIIVLYKLEENIIFFYPPSKIEKIRTAKIVKVGGLVKKYSVVQNHLEIKFSITDNIKKIDIYYSGALPALFREGQGIIASGKLKDNIFIASQLLTKHDENYMPPEVAKTITKETQSGEK